jgi:hypothetical protein
MYDNPDEANYYEDWGHQEANLEDLSNEAMALAENEAALQTQEDLRISMTEVKNHLLTPETGEPRPITISQDNYQIMVISDEFTMQMGIRPTGQAWVAVWDHTQSKMVFNSVP